MGVLVTVQNLRLGTWCAGLYVVLWLALGARPMQMGVLAFLLGPLGNV